ncbi:hypothetical protein ACFLX9_00110 [Chloroflexota bacterium]
MALTRGDGVQGFDLLQTAKVSPDKLTMSLSSAVALGRRTISPRRFFSPLYDKCYNKDADE